MVHIDLPEQAVGSVMVFPRFWGLVVEKLELSYGYILFPGLLLVNCHGMVGKGTPDKKLAWGGFS
jgi:hypothetical protein